MPEDLVGLVAVCSAGRPGLVTGRKQLPWGLSWVGVGLDDGPTLWSSRQPTVVAVDLDAWIVAQSPGFGDEVVW